MHARYRIEAGGRLVEEEDARLVDESPRDLDAAPHAAREHPHRFVAPLRQLHGLEQFVDEPLALVARDAVELREDDQVLLDAQLEVAGHRLRDHADRAADVVGLTSDVEAVDLGRP